MKLIAIVAASENNVIGINNDMPWRLPDDFKFFKEKTMGHPMLMGKNTWLSLGGKPLPGREHLIVSRSLELEIPGVIVFPQIDQAVAYARNGGHQELYIIGGGSIYEQMLPLTDEILLTRIHTIIGNGQVFFPEIRNHGWRLISLVPHPQDNRHAYDFTFEHWVRIQP